MLIFDQDGNLTKEASTLVDSCREALKNIVPIENGLQQCQFWLALNQVLKNLLSLEQKKCLPLVVLRGFVMF